MQVAAALGVKDKVCESMKGMASGSLREQGWGACISHSLKAEGQRSLRRGAAWDGHSGDPLEGRRQVHQGLGGKDRREGPRVAAVCVHCFLFDP